MFKHSQQGSVDVIHGDDSLIVEHIDQISELIDECIKRGQPRIVFDMERVSLIDSSGLEMLVDACERCLQRGGILKLAAPNPLCGEILSITGVAPQFEIFGDVVSAAGSFSQ